MYTIYVRWYPHKHYYTVLVSTNRQSKVLFGQSRINHYYVIHRYSSSTLLKKMRTQRDRGRVEYLFLSKINVHFSHKCAGSSPTHSAQLITARTVLFTDMRDDQTDLFWRPLGNQSTSNPHRNCCKLKATVTDTESKKNAQHREKWTDKEHAVPPHTMIRTRSRKRTPSKKNKKKSAQNTNFLEISSSKICTLRNAGYLSCLWYNI